MSDGSFDIKCRLIGDQQMHLSCDWMTFTDAPFISYIQL